MIDAVKSARVTIVLISCAHLGLRVETAHAQGVCSTGTQECGQFATHAIAPNTSYLLENNAWGDPGQCIQWLSDGEFCVSATPSGIGFPNILQGNVFGTGPTTGWVPRQVSAISAWNAGWSVGGMPTAQPGWNAIIEMWATTTNPTGKNVTQPDGTELMIFLGASPGIVPGPGTITGHAFIDGLYWDVYAGRWPTNQNTTARWNMIGYVLASPPPSDFGRLYGDLTPFLVDAQRQTGVGTGDPLGPCVDATLNNNQCLDSSWWITSIQFGFETFGGGVGLSTDSFSSAPGVNGGCGSQADCKLAALGPSL